MSSPNICLLFFNSAKRIYLFEIKRVRRITSFWGNELATVLIAVVCIALLVSNCRGLHRFACLGNSYGYKGTDNTLKDASVGGIFNASAYISPI